MPNPDKELTVEECLAELREMFPDKESSIEFDTNGRVLVTVFAAVPHFDYHSTLAEAMVQVRAWRLNND